jgi:hypothetical protein
VDARGKDSREYYIIVGGSTCSTRTAGLRALYQLSTPAFLDHRLFGQTRNIIASRIPPDIIADVKRV